MNISVHLYMHPIQMTFWQFIGINLSENTVSAYTVLLQLSI